MKDIHWLLELPDELDILVSEREFEAAVAKIEKARGFRTSQQLALAFGSIADDLDERISKLAETLSKDLQNPALKKSESRTIITFLSRLGFAKRAREIFLDTRSRKVSSEIKFVPKSPLSTSFLFFVDAPSSPGNSATRMTLVYILTSLQELFLPQSTPLATISYTASRIVTCCPVLSSGPFGRCRRY